MANPVANPCVRCGTERIIAKEWTEKVGIGTLTHITTVCPDKECQKLVDEVVEAAREKKLAIEQRKLKNKEERDKLLAEAKANAAS